MAELLPRVSPRLDEAPPVPLASLFRAPDAQWASEGATRTAPDAQWASEGATRTAPDAQWASEGATRTAPDAQWASEGATRTAPDAQWASEGATRTAPDAQWASEGATRTAPDAQWASEGATRTAPDAQWASEGATKPPLWLEIGFGGGEHLLWQARHNPHVGLIGAEPFEDGVVKVLAGIEDDNLGNLLVYADDVRALLRWLPPASISRVFILFPDPWPKRRHQKRRLVNVQLLDLLARVMSSGAELRIGTDIGDYARTILMAFQQNDDFVWPARSPGDWRDRPADWPPTRYEQKALREGRRCCYLRFVRR